MLFFYLWLTIAAGSQSSPRQDNPPQMDTVVAVAPGTRLRVDLSAGSITVNTWKRNAVRVATLTSPSAGISVQLIGGAVNVFPADFRSGIPEADLHITVPAEMNMTLGNGDVAITVNDARGEVIAKNYSGTILVNGGRGVISLKSTLGSVTLRGAQGRIDVEAANAPIRIDDSGGDLQAVGSASHLLLTNVDSRHLEASTVGGVIWFTGPFREGGHYSFLTHGGSIFLSVPEPVNATLAVSTVSGAFATRLPHTRTAGSRRGRFTVKVGSGDATVDLQSFAGGMVLKRPDDPPSQKAWESGLRR